MAGPGIVEAKCPKCGAPLHVQPAAEVVRCSYCGNESIIQQRGKQFSPRPEMRHMTVVQVGAQPARAIFAVIPAILMSVGIGFAVLMSMRSSSSSSGGLIPGLPGLSNALGPSAYFSDKPMLADVNGDGVIDVVGKSNTPGGDNWIAAFNGKDGKQIWKTANITKEAAEANTIRAILFDRLLSTDSLGKVQAYDLKTGQPSWSVGLSDKAKHICEAEGSIVIDTDDKERTVLDAGTGKKKPNQNITKCKNVPTSERDITENFTIIGWWDFEKNGLPSLHSIDGMDAHRALIPNSGPEFAIGSKSKGTSVAMIAMIDKGKVAWKDVVPGVDPLTTSVNVTTQLAAYSNNRLAVPYNMKDAATGGVRMACFDTTSGTRIWDVEIHKKSQVEEGIDIAGDTIFYASWTMLYAVDLKTGKIRYTIGTEF